MSGSAERVLVDSVLLIDWWNGVEAARRYLVELGERAVLSPITRAEVLAGFAPERRVEAVAALDSFACLPIDAPVADLAAELRRVHGWKLPDAFQAALAQRHGLLLATRNTRDFPAERHAWVRVPYRIG